MRWQHKSLIQLVYVPETQRVTPPAVQISVKMNIDAVGGDEECSSGYDDM